MSALSPLGPVAPAPAAADDPAALRQAAQGFEAMFVRRMLEAARGSAQSADQFTTMRDAHLADIAAARGAFGIAAAIEAQLAARPGRDAA